MIKVFIVLCALTAFMRGQGTIQPDLRGLTYPVLAGSARVQGKVQLRAKNGTIELLTGHPMLVAPARQNLEKWQPKDGEVLVTYDFHLTEAKIEPIETEIPIGNRFDRFFRRIFRRAVTRKIHDAHCVFSKPPPTIRCISINDTPAVEIEIDSDTCMLINI